MTDLGGGGAKYGRTETALMMSRNPKNVHPLFSYTLFSRQLGLRSIVPEEEMRKLVDYDEDGNSCIAVLMRGATQPGAQALKLKVQAQASFFVTAECFQNVDCPAPPHHRYDAMPTASAIELINQLT